MINICRTNPSVFKLHVSVNMESTNHSYTSVLSYLFYIGWHSWQVVQYFVVWYIVWFSQLFCKFIYAWKTNVSLDEGQNTRIMLCGGDWTKCVYTGREMRYSLTNVYFHQKFSAIDYVLCIGETYLFKAIDTQFNTGTLTP